MGPQDPQILAEHIYHSVGPSGPNKDYLLCLEAALDGLSPESGDGHITDLASRLRGVEKRLEPVPTPDQDLIDRELEKRDSRDVLEETEKRKL